LLVSPSLITFSGVVFPCLFIQMAHFPTDHLTKAMRQGELHVAIA
jgi:hypothetical protein